MHLFPSLSRPTWRLLVFVAAGLPGLSIPCGLSEGLPVGLQLIGAPWSEPTLLELGRGYEAITADAQWRSLEPTHLAASRS